MDTPYIPTPEDNPFYTRGCCRPPDTQHPRTNSLNCLNSCAKMNTFDWLSQLPEPLPGSFGHVAEVRFKNNRKDFFRMTEPLGLVGGDIVAVEASPGHDIGIVSLLGHVAVMQWKRKQQGNETELKKIYRKARPNDIEKWGQAIRREEKAKYRTRQISRELGLSMKVNDVEFQGDNTKAVFYYTAEERVDFRQLIKALADEFHVRIEMRQIGVRQEASRLGGIGSCGRELCCATWLTDFKSVTTQSARVQQLSLNPQKLAGQCGKLKCCLNYELDVYKDALKDMPGTDIVLKTKKGDGIFQKVDVFRRLYWYCYAQDSSDFLAITAEKLQEIIAMNKKNIFPDKLEDFAHKMEKKAEVESMLEEDDLRRFDE